MENKDTQIIINDSLLVMENFLAMSKEDRRGVIMNFEELIRSQPGSFSGDTDICPLKHSFSDGIYVREIFIPKGTILTGKIHKHDHPNFLMKGKVTVVTEDGGVETIEAPKAMISPKGTKRALVTHEDTIWITVHSNPDNETDISKIEEFVIAKDYDELNDAIISAGSNGIHIIDENIECDQCGHLNNKIHGNCVICGHELIKF